jgi:hypothetical protein
LAATDDDADDHNWDQRLSTDNEHRHRDADDEQPTALRTAKSGTPMRVPTGEGAMAGVVGASSRRRTAMPGNTIPTGRKSRLLRVSILLSPKVCPAVTRLCRQQADCLSLTSKDILHISVNRALI